MDRINVGLDVEAVLGTMLADEVISGPVNQGPFTGVTLLSACKAEV